MLLAQLGWETAAPITPAHHSERPNAARISLVQTFWIVALICNELRA